MLGRRLALLLLVYVSLDFANPFMPGAVSFESGFVDCTSIAEVKARCSELRPAPS